MSFKAVNREVIEGVSLPAIVRSKWRHAVEMRLLPYSIKPLLLREGFPCIPDLRHFIDQHPA